VATFFSARRRNLLKTILNKTRRPIPIPLPLGKMLRLGPNKTGGIADKAVDHPPVKKLLEAGDIEIVNEGSAGKKHRGGSGPVHTSTHGHHGSVTPRSSGDR
jgi:hypothetical protein